MLPNFKLQAWLVTALAAVWIAGVAEACTCPPADRVWARFEDSQIGTPDFWWGDPILIDEIRVCTHAVRFEFLVQQNQVMTRAALVFPNPDAELIESRLGLEPGTPKFASELEHFAKRYESLIAGLNSMFEIPAGHFLSVDFGAAEANECPILVPGRKLALQWRGHELLLRGYLDVYFAIAA
jgi:hypothetical protein